MLKSTMQNQLTQTSAQGWFISCGGGGGWVGKLFEKQTAAGGVGHGVVVEAVGGVYAVCVWGGGDWVQLCLCWRRGGGGGCAETDALGPKLMPAGNTVKYQRKGCSWGVVMTQMRGGGCFTKVPRGRYVSPVQMLG